MNLVGARALVGAAFSASLLFSLPAAAQRPGPPGVPTPAVTTPSPGTSDKTPEEKRTEARQRFQRGLQLFEEGNYEAARVELERAYQLAPSYKILYNIGLCYEQLGDYVQAQSTLQSYLESGGIDVSEDRRAEVNKELGQIRPRIGKLTIHTNVPGIEALVDDVCSTDAAISGVNCAPIPGTSRVILMNPGRRRITFRKDGYVAQTQVVTIAGSDDARLEVTLKPIPRAEERRSNPYLVPTVVAGSAAFAGLATTAVLGILTAKADSDQDDRLNQRGVTREELSDGRSKTRELASFTVGFGIGTGVALLATGYLLYRHHGWKQANGAPAVGANSLTFRF